MYAIIVQTAIVVITSLTVRDSVHYTPIIIVKNVFYGKSEYAVQYFFRLSSILAIKCRVRIFEIYRSIAKCHGRTLKQNFSFNWNEKVDFCFFVITVIAFWTYVSIKNLGCHLILILLRNGEDTPFLASKWLFRNNECILKIVTSMMFKTSLI